jgi:hypothetical protein
MCELSMPISKCEGVVYIVAQTTGDRVAPNM